MTWLTPTLAAIAAAIAVPTLIILYFLKLRRKDVEISTTLLWKKSIQDLQANAPFQKLRRNILLFLQLLALAAILFGLAQPQRTDQEQAIGVKRVILLDRSASMQAIDGGGDMRESGDDRTRLRVAKDEAIELVNAMRQGSLLGIDLGFLTGGGGGGSGIADETMLIVFDSSAEVRQQFTADKAALIRAIEAVEPSDAPSELGRAMTLARAHLPKQTYFDERTGSAIELDGRTLGNVAVHIFSDGRLPDASQVLTQAIEGTDRHPVEYVSVGSTDAANVGITGFSAERDYDNPQQLSVFVGLQNSGRTPRSVELNLLIDGVVERVREVTVPAATRPEGVTAVANQQGREQTTANVDWLPGTIGVVFPIERSEGGVFAASITTLGDATPDTLPADDRAWLIVPPAKRLTVALVTTRGNLYLQEALLGLPLAGLDQFTQDEYIAAVRDGSASKYDVAVFDGFLPPTDDQGRIIPGRYLIYGAAPTPPAGVILGEAQRGAQILDWNRSHPVLRILNLESIQIAELPQVQIPDGSSTQILAESDGGPALLETVTNDIRAMVVPFDPLQSTWPLHVSWPVFNAAAIRYLGLDIGSADSTSRVLQPGGVLSDRLPAGATSVVIQSPDGTRSNLEPASDGRIVFGPIRQRGTYSITWSGTTTNADITQGSRGVRTYAVSLLSPDESNIPAISELQLAATTVSATDTGTVRAAQRLWPYLLLLAMLILLFEWWVYNRKVYL